MLPPTFNFPADVLDVSVVIRDAVAPVFLLTGIGSILSVLVNRLGRSIDRARIINGLPDTQFSQYEKELDIILQRTTWMRWSVGLFIFAGLFVAISIVSVFVGAELKLNFSHIVLTSFIIAMLSLILGLLCFLREIILAAKEQIKISRPMEHR